jgi:hypothetical protein
MDKKSGSVSGIRDEQPGSYFLELRNHFFGVIILKFFDADPGSGMKKIRSGLRDEKKSDPGSGINIPDPQNYLLLLSGSGYPSKLATPHKRYTSGTF